MVAGWLGIVGMGHDVQRFADAKHSWKKINDMIDSRPA